MVDLIMIAIEYVFQLKELAYAVHMAVQLVVHVQPAGRKEHSIQNQIVLIVIVYALLALLFPLLPLLPLVQPLLAVQLLAVQLLAVQIQLNHP
jgi:hypothetical protein